MKILILTEGGRGIGLGHISRCLSLYQAFEEKGLMPHFVINGDKSFEDLLTGVKYRMLNWHRSKKEAFELIKGSKIVIIDSYLEGRDFYKKASELSEMLVCIDDNNRLNYPKAIVLNGSIGAEDTRYSRNKDVKYLLGPRYQPLRKNFWTVPEKCIGSRVRKVLITLGGGDPVGMTPKVLNFLNKAHPELIKEVITGKMFKYMKTVEALAGRNAHIRYSPDAGYIKRLMLGADIAISAGGQTLYELARVGLPTIGICVAENQKNNLDGWERRGFLKNIGRYDEEDIFCKLDKAIGYFQGYEGRMKSSFSGRRMVDGQGARRLVRALLNLKGKKGQR